MNFDKILQHPDNLVPSIIVPHGYAADKSMPKSRFSKEEIFI